MSTSTPTWVISQHVFEADEFCPLMPVWPWGGHRHWAYDLVRFMRPRVIAEIGVHWGTSLFAFAQAVKDAGIPSRLIGVDTWRGDDHTGPYGSEVLAMVRRIIAERFSGLRIDLHPTTFDEALCLVEDASIDLLHIDGFHEYDAVNHDFESWLAKLAPDGVVLLHDVAENTGYGSARYWRELSARYPSFSFEHSWGLGVVFPKGDRWLRAMRRRNLSDKIQIYTHRAMHERAATELRDTGLMAVERLAAIRSMDEMIRDRDNEIVFLKQAVAERARLVEAICLDAIGSDQVPRSDGSPDAPAIAEIAARAIDCIRSARETARRLPEVMDLLDRAARRADESDAQVAGLRRRAQTLTEELSSSEASRRDAAQALAQAQDRLGQLDSQVGRLQQDLAVLSAEHANALARVAGLERRGDVLSADLNAMTVYIEGQRQETRDLRRRLGEYERMNSQLQGDVSRLAADVEMIALRVEQLERIEIERESLANPRGSAARVARPEREQRPRATRS
ncbi:MAG: class I SAM-dependent methyltransferase [Phycisphaeraceae bacterium]|nr:class I SAM-dependent methyltransferase [Phycisphaeraceae bacterium]